MHLIYIDDARDEELCVFSALAIPAEKWRESFDVVRGFRRGLKETDGIFVYKELHAWKFVSGRGNVGDRIVPKGRRCAIFREALALTASLPEAKLFNACFGAKEDEMAFERLLNRINTNMKSVDSHALLICDQGKEARYTKLVRRMGVHNPIPSQYGAWPGGKATRNIPIERVLEDPVFKASERSYFIQLVDFCAYALLRRERQVPSKNAYHVHTAFDEGVQEILVREASRHDPEGILRPSH